MSTDLLSAPSLFAAFHAAAARAPDDVIVRVGPDDLTYAELERESRRAARALLSFGVDLGDTVGIWTTNHLRCVVAGWGNQAVGGTLIPAGTRLKPREVAAILARVEPRVLFLDPGSGSLDFVAEILGEGLPGDPYLIVFDDRPRRAAGWAGRRSSPAATPCRRAISMRGSRKSARTQLTTCCSPRAPPVRQKACR